ncbi:helix-turn-helix domain-containing protein [Kitasatospora sp. NPDC101801]|uniref:helix-turn-helix domain-containing protein n=1 Tax=Kitasatospora sp. NPDC101801 TaxID=3364103 RepID=UPI00381235E0
MTDAQRAARERIRQQAVERFEAGEKSREIAAALRVSVRSAERWRRQWREDGAADRQVLPEAMTNRLRPTVNRATARTSTIAPCRAGRVRLPARASGPASAPVPVVLLAEGRPDAHHHPVRP